MCVFELERYIVREDVCMCVWERETVCVSVCVFEKHSWVWVCEREKKEIVEILCVGISVCVLERERKKR